jgi:iron complex outermembrane receptor protein
VVWRFSHQGELKLLYGRAFRAPSFEELYASNNTVLVGNRQLDPETISSYELGISYRLASDIDLGINYFRNEIRDHIEAVVDPGSVTAYGNHGATDSHGVEGEIKKRWRDVRADLYLNGSYQDSIDTQNSGEQIADVARKRGNAGGNWHFIGNWNINANLAWQGERARPNGDPRDPLPSVAILDVALSTKFCQERCDMKLSLFNLTDKEYADPTPYSEGVPDDIPRPGRTLFLELGYRI